jgi:hypothetical protein
MTISRGALPFKNMGMDMIITKGKAYYAIIDASARMGVSTQTIKDYIRKEIIPQPPIIKYGLRKLQYFSTKYTNLAQHRLINYRQMRDMKSDMARNSDNIPV